MRKFIFVLLTLLLVSPFSFAMKGIIWQPQNRDSQVTDTQWQGLMSQLRLQGFDTLECWKHVDHREHFNTTDA